MSFLSPRSLLLAWGSLCLVSSLCSQDASGSASYPRVILRGDYADPTILRDGADYYMTHSPFLYSPGFLIWHSRDLVNWTPLCRAMTEVVGSAMAPDLVKHQGRYYIYFPAAGVNWVIWADTIRGPWSAPIRLEVNLIDPGHSVGEDGKRYLHLSEGQVVPLSDDGLSVTGPKRHEYSGWVYPREWVTEGMFLESPKVFRREGYYYMVVAQGGTAGPATSHMIAVARSRSVLGPWENSPLNPLVHTYHEREQWWSKGHGSLVDDVNGNWWVVYHAYENGQYPLGRQTLLDPVEWTSDGWPRLAATPHPLPASGTPAKGSGLALSDSFQGASLGLQWTTWRDFSGVAVKDGVLTLSARGESPAQGRLLLTTATDHAYEVEVELTVTERAKGGLFLFYSEKAFAGLETDGAEFVLHLDASRSERQPNPFGRTCHLRVVNRQNRCEFLASRDGRAWTSLCSLVDVSMMHHNRFKGFFALRPALSANAVGEVHFREFRYSPLPAPAH